MAGYQQMPTSTLRETHSASRAPSSNQSSQNQSPRPARDDCGAATKSSPGPPPPAAFSPGPARELCDEDSQWRGGGSRQRIPESLFLNLSMSPATPKEHPSATTPSPRHLHNSIGSASPSTPLSKGEVVGSAWVGNSPSGGSARGASTLIKSPYLSTGSTKRAPSPGGPKGSWGSPAKPKLPLKQR